MKLQKLLLSIFVYAPFVWVAYAGTILDVNPKNALKGESITITLNCEDTSFTTDPVSGVRLFNKGVLAAQSFNVLSDTEIEAVFDLSGVIDIGVFSAVISCESVDFVLENAFTLCDPDINGDGVVNILDHNIFVKYFLKIMPGYAVVPDLIGLSQIEAEQQAANSGFNSSIVKKEIYSNAPLGTVISQTPLAGQVYAKTGSIIFTVSLGIEWVYIDDPGVSGREGFTGYISKYETTNAQYCRYLNDALASGDIRVENNIVYGNSGAYADLKYFSAYCPTAPYSQITYSGGKFTVRIRDGIDMGNHPAGSVSWYGAKAFCEHFGCRLPTEWEWQAVADYDGSYIYGCGLNINYSLANYGISNPMAISGYPYTSTVGHFGEFGYGLCDMAGNLHEWTDSLYIVNPVYPVIRGGDWLHGVEYCSVSYRYCDAAESTKAFFGFRVVQD